MGMTMAEKILARHAGKETVSPGDLVMARVDIVLGNDITAPVAIKEFYKIGVDKIFDRERIVLVPDHFTPNKDINSAEQSKALREFARKFDLKYYYEIGRMGVEHALLPEEGLTLPGDLIIGADSHTCTYGAVGALGTGVGSTDMAAAMATGEAWFKVPPTIKFVYNGQLQPWVGGKDLILHTIGDIGVDGARYKSMEFSGAAIETMEMDGRFTMSNMAIEAGAMAGLIAPDSTTREYIKYRAKRTYREAVSDKDAVYEKIIEYDVSTIEPQVAFPHLPENSRSVKDAGHIVLDQVVIGSCTNGRIEDLRVAAKLLQGKKVHPHLRLLIIPATQAIYTQAMEEGLFKIFLAAEAAISTPTCGPCLGGHMGILAAGEKGLATTNRNFVGRMGHPESELYLCGPAVAAASAITGCITHPEEVI